MCWNNYGELNVYCQVGYKDGGICYNFTLEGREYFVPVGAPLTEVFKKLRGEWTGTPI